MRLIRFNNIRFFMRMCIATVTNWEGYQEVSMAQRNVILPLTQPASAYLLKHACVHLCWGVKSNQKWVFYAVLSPGAFYLTCEKWKNPRNLIWRQAGFEQTLWGVVFHQNVLPVLMWGKIQEKQVWGKRACFSSERPMTAETWRFSDSSQVCL